MTTILAALLKGLRLTKGKVFLCWVAAILSAWGISTMIYGYRMTDRDFEVNFRATNPADLVVQSGDSSTDIRHIIQAHPAVQDVERREAIAARIRNGSGNWMFLQLFLVEDPLHPRISKFNMSQANGVGIERSGLIFLAENPDSVQLRFNDTQRLKLAFGGRVADPGQAPSQMEQSLYGYMPLAEFPDSLGQRGARYIVDCRGTLSKEDLQAIAEELKVSFKDTGVSCTVTVPPPGEHPHQAIVDGIGFLQWVFGGVVSLLGLILLSLIVVTWLYPQISQVGVMKALGATTPMLIGAYVITLLTIIGSGSIVGQYLGYQTAKLYDKAIAFIQNFDQVTTPLPLVDHVVVLLVALVIPMLFVLFPLIHVARTSVRSALNHIFQAGFRQLFRVTQKSVRSTPIKYTLNNLFRSRQRTILLFVLMAAGIALYTTGVNLKHSLREDFNRYAGDAYYPLTVSLKQSSSEALPFLDSIPWVEATSHIQTKSVRYQTSQQPNEQGTILRIYELGYHFDAARMTQGSFRAGCDNCVYVNQQLAPDFTETPIGSTITLTFPDGHTQSFVYSGVIKDIMHPGFYAFSSQKNSSWSEIAVRLRGDFSTSEGSRLLDDSFNQHGIVIRQVSDINRVLLALQNHLAPMYLVIEVIGIVTVIIALIGLAIVLGLTINERAREIGILKAIGSSNRQIINTFHGEYLVVSVVSILVGAVLGYYFNSIICNMFGVMLIKAPVPPLNDFAMLGLVACAVLLLQTAVTYIYVGTRLRKQSANLMTDVT